MKRIVWVIILLIIAGGGFAAWSFRFQKHTTNTNNTTQQPTDPSEGGKYLVIKEWGVRFKLPNGLADAQYEYASNSIVYLSTDRFKRLPGCEQASGISTLERGRGNDSIGPTTVNELLANNPNTLTKAGDYYYATINGGLSCLKSDNQQLQDYYKNTQLNFSTAVKTIQEVPR